MKFDGGKEKGSYGVERRRGVLDEKERRFWEQARSKENEESWGRN